MEINKSLSTPPEIFSILTNELKLATLCELQTVYDTSDVFDLLEVIDAHDTLTSVARKRAEAERDKQR